MRKELNRDVEYLVFEDKGVVVCKLWGCDALAYDKIGKYIPNRLLDGTVMLSYFIDKVYTGLAKCAPEDDFDLEYGKKLALTRARAKRTKAVNDAISKYINDTLKAIDDLTHYGIHKIPDEKEVEL